MFEPSCVRAISPGQAAWDARRGDRKYVGLDVHKATIEVAIGDEGRGEVGKYGTIRSNPKAVLKPVPMVGPARTSSVPSGVNWPGWDGRWTGYRDAVSTMTSAGQGGEVDVRRA